MQDLSRAAAETMAILSEMKADLPDSALGTPSWSRLGRLEDLLMRVLAQSDLALSELGSHRRTSWELQAAIPWCFFRAGNDHHWIFATELG
jgi:hypothetical protein